MSLVLQLSRTALALLMILGLWLIAPCGWAQDSGAKPDRSETDDEPAQPGPGDSDGPEPDEPDGEPDGDEGKPDGDQAKPDGDQAKPDGDQAKPDGEPPPPGGDKAAAESLFRLGQVLLDAKRYDEACAKLAESMRLDPSAGTMMNLARCHQLAGRTATAWAGYCQAESMLRAAGRVERANVAREYALALEPKLSRLTVAVEKEIPGMTLVRNGVELGPASLGVAIAVDPGTHQVEVRAPGYETFKKTVEVGAVADNQVVSVTSLPKLRYTLAERAEQRTSYLRTAGIIMLGAGVAAMAAGGICGVVAADRIDEAESDDALCGGDKACTPAGLDQVAEADRLATVATLALGIGGAAVAGSFVLIVTGELAGLESPESTAGGPAKITLAPLLSPYGGGLLLTGAF